LSTEDEHKLEAERVGRVHGISPGVRVDADLVRWTACNGPPAIGCQGQEMAVALLDAIGPRAGQRALLSAESRW
jgi:hypothetical protein